ncbi:hypothetical protein ACFX2I_044763 [Malus domestica]
MHFLQPSTAQSTPTAGRHHGRTEPPPSSCVPDNALRSRELERRAYGSAAAQLQYDDDYYYDGQDEEEERRKTSRNRMLGSDGWVPGRGVQWVPIGDRGAKKHFYAERLSKLLEVRNISMGSLIRQELNRRSSLYKEVKFSVRNLNLQSKEELKYSPADAEQTKSLEDYYRKQNKLIDFQVQAAPGETWQGLLAALHLQHINAVNSSQKLTA